MSPARLEGVSPVVETPFTLDGEVDAGDLAALVDHLAGSGVSSVMYPGFASESLKLSDQERDEFSALVIEQAHAGGILAVASVSDHATHLAARRAERLVSRGADLVNLLPPYQLAPDPASVRAHVLAVLDAVSPVPVVLQVAPALTGSALSAAWIAEIAQTRPNLLHVKVEATPPGPFITDLRAQAPGLTNVVGYAGVQLIDAVRRGAVGVQPGCSFAELYVRLWRSWTAGDHDAAIALHTRMLPYLSYWMQGVELIVAAEKRISLRRGLISTDVCREPRHRLDVVEEAMIDRFLEEFAADLAPRHPLSTERSTPTGTENP